MRLFFIGLGMGILLCILILFLIFSFGGKYEGNIFIAFLNHLFKSDGSGASNYKLDYGLQALGEIQERNRISYGWIKQNIEIINKIASNAKKAASISIKAIKTVDKIQDDAAKAIMGIEIINEAIGELKAILEAAGKNSTNN